MYCSCTSYSLWHLQDRNLLHLYSWFEYIIIFHQYSLKCRIIYFQSLGVGALFEYMKNITSFFRTIYQNIFHPNLQVAVDKWYLRNRRNIQKNMSSIWSTLSIVSCNVSVITLFERTAGVMVSITELKIRDTSSNSS